MLIETKKIYRVESEGTVKDREYFLKDNKI
jgi:hypothetical protein